MLTFLLVLALLAMMFDGDGCGGCLVVILMVALIIMVNK